MNDIADKIRKKKEWLKFSEFNLTKPIVMQEELTQEYGELIAKAKTGDEVAISEYMNFIDNYLAHSQSMYASSRAYIDIYNRVQADLASLREMSDLKAHMEKKHDSLIESIDKSKYKSSELLIAIETWVEIFGDNGLFHKASIKEKQAPVKFVKKHLERKYGITDTRKLGRISTIVNYREK